MVESSPFRMPLTEWRHHLQDINFWLNGYLNNPAYHNLEEKLDRYAVQWNVGVGPTACFTRAISSITRDVNIRNYGPFDHVIEVDMKQAAAVLGNQFDINDMLHIKVAEQLGLLEHKYDMIDAEQRYYTYNMEKKQDDTVSPLEVKYFIDPQIMQNLRTKKYLLVVHNLDRPIKPIDIHDTTEGLWLPAPGWNGSFWIISTTSQYVYDRSNKPDEPRVIKSFSGDNILILTLHSLKQAAKYISVAVGHGEEKYWHHVAVQCFHYATMLLLIPCSSNVDPPKCDAQADVSSDVLIRQWAAQGILPVMKPSVQEKMGEDTDGYHCQYYGDDIYQLGNVILEAFREYSLLQLPFSPATNDDEATISAAHFLAYHSLVVEPLTSGELCEGNYFQLERMQWISHVGDQGWHVSRDWLSQGSSGPTTLIIRHCSQHSRLFMKLESDDFLAKLPYLRVLDISYTPIESLPSSICCLQKLQLLSLKGCYNLRSPFSFPDTEITLCANNSNKKLNLLYLDLSYSNISTFQCDFFHSIPTLKELLLVKCSNLEELPLSALALSTLTKLEIIDNKKFISFSRLTEMAFDGHGTLHSFSLDGTPHIKRLSLHGCSKLESVDIKEVDALEELDLSATAIKELPDNIPNLPQLRRLLLRGVPSLRRFPWHKLDRFPDVFCLDQCSSDGTVNHDCSTPKVAQVCISDSRLFYSFKYATRDLVRRGRLLKSFNVQITSCKATTRKIQDEEGTVKTNNLHASLAAYADVNCRYLTDGVLMVSMDDVPPFRETERHVEISAVERYPHGLKYLLAVTKSISMSDDTHVSCLNDLSSLDDTHVSCLKLQRCHRMVLVFKDAYYVGRSLKNAHVSHLKSLTHFYKDWKFDYDFHALKHLRLEHCPRLEGVMPRGSALPSLVTLDILFCYNLKAIFYYNRRRHSSTSFELPCLRRIHLQELPLLEHLRDDDAVLAAPAWEELHVRGCWSLHRLPRLIDRRPGKKAVTVSGERAWWTKLRWDDRDDSHCESYEPRLPPASASIRERVIIKTYLR
ncbi:uncharacterized protein LOC120683348 isoform X2 [Panicum virgatum]|uniref:uncharacterized protein LOC120683348 isoform X2 n=1 Tax=Panicum virgatum TaxID=38727 RepID=UPI0019D689D3|nr:uncharacterized protein LOC120683348 isoform X2 [Panicum virgatum]XP_039821358.1 uncharacterized protein LOC120683348 isoform X2 [Panicum virgatum]